jgi:hypothetical protein
MCKVLSWTRRTRKITKGGRKKRWKEEEGKEEKIEKTIHIHLMHGAIPPLLHILHGVMFNYAQGQPLHLLLEFSSL